MIRFLTFFATLSAYPVAAVEMQSQASQLKIQFEKIASQSDGRLGVCAIFLNGDVACANGDQRFSMQSVMKLIVGAAVLDRVDHGEWRLDAPVTIKKKDLSLNIQPLADIVLNKGELTTDISDLVFRAITQSDSAATDILFARLGGSSAINAFLESKGIDGIRVDRDERHLQTETDGLTWQPEYTDPDALDKARAGVSAEIKEAAFTRYRADIRDTATPLAMALFLRKLADGKMLSRRSASWYLDVLTKTRTFPDRLKSGTPQDWKIGHKTGTSDTVAGINAVTNDVGILTKPDGETIAIAVFVADSRQGSDHRAALIAACARAVTGK